MVVVVVVVMGFGCFFFFCGFLEIREMGGGGGLGELVNVVIGGPCPP